jgi:hypothetical protein
MKQKDGGQQPQKTQERHMAGKPDKARRKQLTEMYVQQETAKQEALRYLPLNQHLHLLHYVDNNLAHEGCDHTPRFTMQWVEEHGGKDIDAERLKESLALLGGYCDCEVVANTDPDPD